MKPMDRFLSLIAEKVIDVRPDGTVWKLRNLNAMPLPAPRRMETRSKRGYLAVKIHVGGSQSIVAAHRLVWTVLRGPIPPGMDINHLDGNKHNNHPSNLEVATRGENHRHAYSTKLRGLSRTTPKPILEQIAPRAKALRAQGLSFAAIARELGVAQTTAFRAVRM